MILIKNGKILTMTGRNLENGCVLISEGKIERVGENIDVPKGEVIQVIDAAGGYVVPGFIDAHCHLGMIEEDMGVEGHDVNEATDPVTPHMRGIDGINPLDPAFKEAVEAGVTTVASGPGSANVIGGQFAVFKTKGVCIDEMVIMEPAAMKVAFGENPKRVYNGKGKTPSTRMGTAAVLRETLVKAGNYMKKKENALKKGELFEEDIRMEAMLPVIKGEMTMKAHAHRADDMLTAMRIAREFNLKLSLDHCTDGNIIADRIAAQGVPAIVGPTMTFRTKVETRGKSFDTPARLMKAGVKCAIMTDHPVIPIQYLPMCAGLAAKEGLTLEEALKTITLNAAEILGVEHRVGSIQEGKDADVVIFDGNPLELFSNVLYTIIDGKIAYKK